MEAILDVVAGITKASKEQLRFFAVFLSCIPLGILHRYLPVILFTSSQDI
jgi:hypothetical protein